MLVRRSGDLADAQDALQEALLAAATQWPVEGVPDNPHAWLVVVGQRRLVDAWRSQESRRRREELFASPGAGQDADVYAFASDVEADQRMEINRMSAMLKERQ